MRTLPILGILFAFGISASAQVEPLPDTTDWRQYYPLQVGNTLEWDSFIWYDEWTIQRWEMIGDTLIHDQRYIIERRSTFTTDQEKTFLELDREHISYLRYDTTRTRVVSYSERDDREYDHTCDLSASFGDTIECSVWGVEDEALVGGGYYINGDPDRPFVRQISDDELTLPSVKAFDFGIGIIIDYGSGLGELLSVSEGNNGGVDLIYARLGGRSYGASIVATSAEPEYKIAGSVLSVYPNPATSKLFLAATVQGTSPGSVEIVDLLGRRIHYVQTKFGEARYEIDVDQWPPGLYVARYLNRGQVTVVPIVIAR